MVIGPGYDQETDSRHRCRRREATASRSGRRRSPRSCSSRHDPRHIAYWVPRRRPCCAATPCSRSLRRLLRARGADVDLAGASCGAAAGDARLLRPRIHASQRPLAMTIEPLNPRLLMKQRRVAKRAAAGRLPPFPRPWEECATNHSCAPTNRRRCRGRPCRADPVAVFAEVRRRRTTSERRYRVPSHPTFPLMSPPAESGVQSLSRTLMRGQATSQWPWISRFAGMTARG